jgi:hypothetical protein
MLYCILLYLFYMTTVMNIIIHLTIFSSLGLHLEMDKWMMTTMMMMIFTTVSIMLSTKFLPRIPTSLMNEKQLCDKTVVTLLFNL